ncbi:beta-ketoacyl-[acyl-carrier-protein] synthase family protein [Enterobacter sp. Bisph1]|uniref:beta-ketoacyl-[acyl-carrier-protein] synthase family protein n=1 Tax=Enterobacter sp. Bisph1 TaxID=1274399 RepID=UPI00057C2FD3|nr:beta-ketoacyl-[acyl-carrier-protein] synthase family protein [Enterobacter sp. Bisph1]
MRQFRVVITGMGAVNALGENVEQCWQAIREKRNAFHKLKDREVMLETTFFSFLAENKKRFSGIPNELLHFLPKHGKLALTSAREAVSQAFGTNTPPTEYYAAHRCGVILGSGWGALDEICKLNSHLVEKGITNPRSNIITMPGAMTAACAMQYGFKGYQNTLMAACATGTMAIGEAYEHIRTGRADCMLAGGSESLTGTFGIWSIDILKALSKEAHLPEKASCPFSLDRTGFVLAEGSAVVCLENYETAQKRGACILGEITGYSSFSEGEHMIRPAQEVDCRARTLEQALANARLNNTDVGYINAHGTSTLLNDYHESCAIKKAFGTAAYHIPVSSTKSYTGHLIGAAGSFETIICTKVINENFIPATINLFNPDPKCDLNYVPNDHLLGTCVNNAMNISAGFGGHNAALIISKVG